MKAIKVHGGLKSVVPFEKEVQDYNHCYTIRIDKNNKLYFDSDGYLREQVIYHPLHQISITGYEMGDNANEVKVVSYDFNQSDTENGLKNKKVYTISKELYENKRWGNDVPSHSHSTSKEQ